MQLTYECAAAPENAADSVGSTCRRMLPHLLTSILGWRFADGDDGWSPRHVPYNQSNHILVSLVNFRYTYADSKSACFFPGANWTQRLAAVDVLGPVLAMACSCRCPRAFCARRRCCF
jgi:hypothetical protein